MIQSHPRDWVVSGKLALARCSEHSQFQTQNSLQPGIGPGLFGWGQVHKSLSRSPLPPLCSLCWSRTDSCGVGPCSSGTLDSSPVQHVTRPCHKIVEKGRQMFKVSQQVGSILLRGDLNTRQPLPGSQDEYGHS